MVISALLEKGKEILCKRVERPYFEAELLLSQVLGQDRLYLATHKDFNVSAEDEEQFLGFCKRRARGEPAAYITGHKEFMSLDFKVNKNVLIPRPDTEILVDLIIEKYQNESIDFLDICTGSGAIACSVAYYVPKSSVSATDISISALEVAQINASKLVPQKNISFYAGDALEKIELNKKFDVVASNPPYIETLTINNLDKGVKDFEPLLALDGGPDGLIFYEKIVHNIESVLKPHGELFFEIGFNQAKSVCEIMKYKFKNIETYKDFGGCDRVVCGQLA